MRFLLPILAFCAWMCLLPHGRGAAPEWSQYRGPSRTGISGEPGTLANWSGAGPVELWVSQVGTGYASMTIADGRLYTTGNRTNLDTVYCLNATNGQVLWSHSYPALLDPNQYEGGTSATPMVDGDRLYTVSKWGDLFCFNRTNGAIIWQTNVKEEFNLRLNFWGIASSPLIVGDQLVLNAGADGLSLNKSDGALRWLHNTNRNGYAMPVLYNAEGTPSVLIFGFTNLVSVRVADGVPNWAMYWKTFQDVNACDPILYRGRILVTSDRSTTPRDTGMMLSVTNNSLTTNWSSSALKTHLSPGVVLGQHLYTFIGNVKDVGHFICLDLETGAQRWVRPNIPAGAVISAGGRLVALQGDGWLALLDANPNSAQSSAPQVKVLNGRCWAPPAFNRGILYVRDATGTLKALQMNWTPENIPLMAIQKASQPGRVVVSWPVSATNYQLQAAPLPPVPGGWVNVTNPPAVVGNTKVVTNDAPGAGKAFRLLKP